MKKTSRNLRYVLVVIVLAGVYLYLRGPEIDPRIRSVARSLGISAALAPGESSASTAANSSAEDIAAGGAAAASVTLEFQNWVTAESAGLERDIKDPASKEAELKRKAQSLTSAEMRYLKAQASAEVAPGNTRIFSIYLLSLTPEASGTVMSEYLSEPSRFPETPPTHSPEETLAMQEKTLKRMAIDALIKRVQNEPAYRDELQKTISAIPDSALREYAQKALDQVR